MNRRLQALESANVRQQPTAHRGPVTPEEAEACYRYMLGEGEPAAPIDPTDYRTPAERYMAMLGGPIRKRAIR